MSGKVAAIVVGIAIIYIVIGGLIFKVIEEENDEKQRHRIRMTLDSLFLERDNNISLEEVRLVVVPTIKEAFQYNVPVLGNDSDSASNWDMYSSTFFAVTVVTTIGYGNTPLKTDEGRMFCIFYALAGIPLCLFALFVIGQEEKKFLYYVAKKLAFGFRENEHKLHIFSTIMVSIGGSVVFIYLSAVVFMLIEKWSYSEAVYFCVITLLTVGFGDYVAGWSSSQGKLWYRLLIGVWILFGLSWCTNVISICQDIYVDLFERTRKVAGAVGEKIESSVKSKIGEMTKSPSCESTNSANNAGQYPTISKLVTSVAEHQTEKEKPSSHVAEQCPVSEA